MSYAYPTVAIGSQNYSVYGLQESADTYLEPMIGTIGDAWRAASANDKARALVSATRWLDSIGWAGEKTDSIQELSWPRTSIANVSDSEIPNGIVYGMYELAAALVDDPDLRNTLQEPLARSMSAGSVSMTYFRPRDVQVPTPVPKNVMALVVAYMQASDTSVGGPIASGTDGDSNVDEPYDFRHGL
jgi:hypothetical protein